MKLKKTKITNVTFTQEKMFDISSKKWATWGSSSRLYINMTLHPDKAGTCLLQCSVYIILLFFSALLFPLVNN